MTGCSDRGRLMRYWRDVSNTVAVGRTTTADLQKRPLTSRRPVPPWAPLAPRASLRQLAMVLGAYPDVGDRLFGQPSPSLVIDRRADRRTRFVVGHADLCRQRAGCPVHRQLSEEGLRAHVAAVGLRISPLRPALAGRQRRQSSARGPCLVGSGSIGRRRAAL